MQLYVNHLGYPCAGPKRAVIDAPQSFMPAAFELRDAAGTIVHAGSVERRGPVDGWKGRYFWTADFSAFCIPGRYHLEVPGAGGTLRGERFDITESPYDETLVSDLVYGFKSTRCSGIFDKADARVPLFGTDRKVDARGGWYDASGDTSKYLSHLSYANFMNPQQIPLVAWSLLASAEALSSAGGLPAYLEERMVDEGLFGADFLVRMQDAEGYFYQTLFDVWSKDIRKRELCSYRTQKGIKEGNYRAGWRQGGGMAVAALARAARVARADWPAEYAPADYLAAAAKGFSWLEAHGVECLPDGKENIIDDYCALLAATELFLATGDGAYAAAGDARAGKLAARLDQSGPVAFWKADELGQRSFFHASDAGMPVIALLAFAAALPGSPLASEALSRARAGLEAELALASGDDNPFGYPRQFVRLPGKPDRVSFFAPHDNGTGYWWQGENARLGSLAAAALLGAAAFGERAGLAAGLRGYAASCMDWILGLNPFDVCMLHGRGRNNPQYIRGYFAVPGGICNGITSGFDDESDIAFMPRPQVDDPAQSWRWAEQWLPHGAWFLYALCLRMKG